MIKLYSFPLSGHAHRVHLMLSLLNVEHETIEVNLAEGEQGSEGFLKLNPFHHVPVLEDDDLVIRDSNAIVAYLARKYDEQWYPTDAKSTAKIQEWLAVATKEIVAGPANARLVNVFGADMDSEALIANSHELFAIIEAHLSKHSWFANDEKSIADVAMYTYIAHAPEGGVSLEAYPNIRVWLKRVEALDGFVAMQKTAVGLAA